MLKSTSEHAWTSTPSLPPTTLQPSPRAARCSRPRRPLRRPLRPRRLRAVHSPGAAQRSTTLRHLSRKWNWRLSCTSLKAARERNLRRPPAAQRPCPYGKG